MKKFPKVLSISNKLLDRLFDDPVEVSEKVDGSQWRIHLTEDQYTYGSKNVGCTTEGMFDIARTESQIIYQDTDWRTIGDDITLFCEFLSKPKQNTLSYDRVPQDHLYLFGAIVDDRHLSSAGLKTLAKVIGIDPPNIIYIGEIHNPVKLEELLDTESYLGGCRIEGVVCKNIHKTYDPLLLSSQAFMDYPLVGKFVNPKFTEVNMGSHKKNKVNTIDKVAATFFTEARLQKSIQHLREEGKINDENSDLRFLVPEFYNDLWEEEKDIITKILLGDILKTVRKKASSYVVNEYKKILMKDTFKQ